MKTLKTQSNIKSMQWKNPHKTNTHESASLTGANKKMYTQHSYKIGYLYTDS